jgi:hypothetical protein
MPPTDDRKLAEAVLASIEIGLIAAEESKHAVDIDLVKKIATRGLLALRTVDQGYLAI